MNLIWLLMSIAAIILAINSPIWWLNLIALVCAVLYLIMSIEDSS